jgi:hypothetical protein
MQTSIELVPISNKNLKVFKKQFKPIDCNLKFRRMRKGDKQIRRINRLITLWIKDNF